jgi:probable H4MPT-linked C1 transfer pathway protein
MSMASVSWMALDVGGANIKAAHTSGQARTLPFELWKRPDELGLILGALAATFPPCDRVALTMTAELCDCYPTKRVGVNAVLDAVEAAFRGRPIEVWGVDGRFHEPAAIRRQPVLAAASNWLALATLVARLVPDGPGLLIDIGTTTTDLIPLAAGRVAARGRTDTERLQNGELVYAGVRRTPICALATELPVCGVPTGLAAELFASTLDVYLTLGEIEPDPKDLSTADGRPATKAASRDRLARMIGTDRDSFGVDDALAFALAAHEALLSRLAAAADRACRVVAGRPRVAIVAGSGEFLARALAQRLVTPGGTIIGLNEAWGTVASSAGCAHALLVLAGESDRGEGRGDVEAEAEAEADGEVDIEADDGEGEGVGCGETKADAT